MGLGLTCRIQMSAAFGQAKQLLNIQALRRHKDQPEQWVKACRLDRASPKVRREKPERDARPGSRPHSKSQGARAKRGGTPRFCEAAVLRRMCFGSPIGAAVGTGIQPALASVRRVSPAESSADGWAGRELGQAPPPVSAPTLHRQTSEVGIECISTARSDQSVGRGVTRASTGMAWDRPSNGSRSVERLRFSVPHEPSLPG